MTTTIENLHNNKRKFISDDEVHPPSVRILSIANQVESSCNTKKMKLIETERLSTSITEVNETEDMMICENSNLKINDTTNKSQAVSVPKHCNGICNADASPTTLIIRCYCDPYRFNELIPYGSDIY